MTAFVGGPDAPPAIRTALDVAFAAGDTAAVTRLSKKADAVAHAAELALGRTAEARPYVIEALRGRWYYAQLAGPNPGGNGKSLDNAALSKDGLTPMQRERWRQLFYLSADAFDRMLRADPDEWPTFKAACALASRHRVDAARAAYDTNPTYDAPVRRGDFRTVLADLEPGSVDLVLTDPPYAADAVGVLEDLGEHAARWLRPGGSLVVMCGHTQLPDVLVRVGAHLRYWWTLSAEMSRPQRVPGKFVYATWKPLLWFVKGHRSPSRILVDGLRSELPDQSEHRWAQSVELIWPVVEALTDPGDLVVDPFAGTGRWGRSILVMKRRWVGADVGGAVVV